MASVVKLKRRSVDPNVGLWTTNVGLRPSGESKVEVDIAKFIPLDMRARMVQDVIAEMGIRPLSNAIGVNSKTVYKYKCGSSCPANETMAEILMLMREKYPSLLERYIDELRNNFSVALEALLTLKVQPIKEPRVTLRTKSTQRQRQPKMEKREPTPKEATEVTKFVIYESLGLSNPADRMTLAKILAVMQGAQTFNTADIAQKSNISQDLVDRYTNMLVEAGHVEKISSGAYRLAVRIQM